MPSADGLETYSKATSDRIPVTSGIQQDRTILDSGVRAPRRAGKKSELTIVLRGNRTVI
jgi:hypothetical protein